MLNAPFTSSPLPPPQKEEEEKSWHKLTMLLLLFHACHMLHASQDRLKLDKPHQVPLHKP
jgi:hypothetical protein